MDGGGLENQNCHYDVQSKVVWTRTRSWRIQADEVDSRVKWGMTVEVIFEALEK